MVFMVTFPKTKSAISRLLIKLETCSFQYLHLCFQLLMIMLEEELDAKMAKTPHTTPCVNAHIVPSAQLTMTSSVF